MQRNVVGRENGQLWIENRDSVLTFRKMGSQPALAIRITEAVGQAAVNTRPVHGVKSEVGSTTCGIRQKGAVCLEIVRTLSHVPTSQPSFELAGWSGLVITLNRVSGLRPAMMESLAQRAKMESATTTPKDDNAKATTAMEVEKRIVMLKAQGGGRQ